MNPNFDSTQKKGGDDTIGEGDASINFLMGTASPYKDYSMSAGG